jgi:hypothetical protein
MSIVPTKDQQIANAKKQYEFWKECYVKLLDNNREFSSEIESLRAENEKLYNVIREKEMREDLLKKENAALRELVREAEKVMISYFQQEPTGAAYWLAKAKQTLGTVSEEEA